MADDRSKWYGTTRLRLFGNPQEQTELGLKIKSGLSYESSLQVKCSTTVPTLSTLSLAILKDKQSWDKIKSGLSYESSLQAKCSTKVPTLSIEYVYSVIHSHNGIQGLKLLSMPYSYLMANFETLLESRVYALLTRLFCTVGLAGIEHSKFEHTLCCINSRRMRLGYVGLYDANFQT